MKPLRFAIVAPALVMIAGACAGPAGSAVPSTGGAGEAPLGAWKVTITEGDFRAAGLTDDGAISENAGTFTFTLTADGTFTEAQQADHPIRWPVFRGTWTETSPTVLELRTTFPPEFVGEVVVVGWMREAENLRLRLVSPDEPFLKVHFETHPWSPAP